MRLSDKTAPWSMGSKTYEGKYKGNKCTISYTSEYYNKIPYWYFLCTSKEDDSYNSLRDGLKYDTQEECHNECIKYIDNKNNTIK